MMSVMLEHLNEANALHMDHYGGHRLAYSCIKAQGIYKTFLHLKNPHQQFEVMDISGGYASACLGANNAHFWQRLHAKVLQCSTVTDELLSLERTNFLQQQFGSQGLWTDHFPYGEYHISGRNSGSEGIELALRLLLESLLDKRRQAKHPQKINKKIILAFEGAWHGWTAGIIPLLNRGYYTHGFPSLEREGLFGIEIKFLPFGDQTLLERFFEEFGENIAGVVVEPIQGDAGILVPPAHYLRRLADLCQHYQALLIADEVLTFAKTGQFFAMTDAIGPIKTDITIIGKSLGMGLIPISLVIAKKTLNIRACGAVATNDLRDFTCAVMSAGLQVIHDQKLMQQSKMHDQYLQQKLQIKLVEAFPDIYKECRGVAHLFGVELTEYAAQKLLLFRENMIHHGIYLEFMAGAGKRSHGLRYIFPTMRIAPALIMDDTQLTEMLERLIKASFAFRLLMQKNKRNEKGEMHALH
jgi:acetylornithine/N-succinyldiaminopimelate aminotransferase